jgi:cytochrome b561
MKSKAQFNIVARSLHWLMALAIIAMLTIGVIMVTSLQYHSALLNLHRPLGIGILALALIRLFNRWLNPPPPLPHDLPRWQMAAAHASHWMLYGMMPVLPLLGWAMLSAGGYPIQMTDGIYLSSILPQSAALYGILRPLHGLFAYLFFFSILAHLGAALYHAWVRRDGVFAQITVGVSPGRHADHDSNERGLL